MMVFKTVQICIPSTHFKYLPIIRSFQKYGRAEANFQFQNVGSFAHAQKLRTHEGAFAATKMTFFVTMHFNHSPTFTYAPISALV